MNPNSIAAQILSDPSASYWLKDAVRSLLSRDVVDALNDTERLMLAITDHYQTATGRRK